MSRIIIGFVLLVCAVQSSDGLPAGPSELQKINEEIAIIQKALDLVQAKIDAHRRIGEDWLEAKIAGTITQLGTYSGPISTTASATEAYITMLRYQIGWGPTDPIPDDVRQWIGYRRMSHLLDDEWEMVRISQIRLQEIRDRLRKQLGKQK